MDDPYKFAGGKENAFLIQNAFPIIAEFFDHIHTVENKPVTVHNELNRILTENLGEVLALYNRGIHLIFTDIDKIRTIMEQEFENTGCSENVSRDTINNNYTHIYNMLYELKKHRKIGYISLDDSRKQNLVEYEEKEQKKIYDTIKTEDIHEVIKFLKRRCYRNFLSWLFAKNPVKSILLKAVRSGKKQGNVCKSYIIPAPLLY